jgi:hypothetical protein
MTKELVDLEFIEYPPRHQVLELAERFGTLSGRTLRADVPLPPPETPRDRCIAAVARWTRGDRGQCESEQVDRRNQYWRTRVQVYSKGPGLLL